MKYKLKIVPQDGGYVGYALLNDEIAFTTAVNKDASSVSKELSVFVSTAVPPAAVVVPSKPQITASTTTYHPQPTPVPHSIQTVSTNPTPSAPRRCCGRG